jgi:ribonucleoside-diphosphate reductase alpha chain
MLKTTRPLKTAQWSESALRVLRERYLKRRGAEILETPEEMVWRVATAIAEAERRWGRGPEAVEEIATQFYDMMLDGTFLPNSPTLMNAGKGNGLQYSACYVLPVGDSMEEIFEAVKAAAIIHKSGGGTGFAFSRLRPKDSLVASTGGKASGPVSFLRVFNGATEAVKQGGTRRGANMGILRVDHPDILEFIDAKLDGGITNFNISVAATDAFMKALGEGGEYALIAPHTRQVVGRLSAPAVFQRIVRAAWATGDPGMIFVDRINAGRANPTPALAEVEATNPCGEQPLYPNEACNLGSLNVAKFARPGAWGTATNGGRGSAIAWDEMERVIRLAARFLDDVIEVNPYPLPEIDAAVKANRRIGLGVMGWADLLCLLGIPYDSDEALALGDEVMAFIERIGHDESARLATQRGPFPHWPHSIYREGPPRRNSTVTTIAPTGTISIIAGCSSGIEPLFAIAFRHIVGDRHLTFVNPYFEQVARARGFHGPALMEAVARSGSVRGVAGVPEDVQRVFVTAHEVGPAWHVRHQGVFQRHTDNGVSKTINLPHAATIEDVADAYRLAYEVGCLGITVFRDGCKETQVLHVGAGEAAPPAAGAPAAPPAIKPRPRRVAGVTDRVETPVGTAFVTVNRNGVGEPFEVFIQVGKGGADVAADGEAIGRLISLALRLPSPLPPRRRLEQIVDQLRGIGGARPLGFGKERVRSLADGIAHVLDEYLRDTPEAPSAGGNGRPGRGAQGELFGETKVGDLCPDCGHAALVYEEGCQKCYACGYAEC